MGGAFKILRFQTPKPKQIVAPVVDVEAEAKRRAEEERLETLERQRRGQEGTIHTSYNGILGEKEDTLKRKNLLGD